MAHPGNDQRTDPFMLQSPEVELDQLSPAAPSPARLSTARLHVMHTLSDPSLPTFRASQISQTGQNTHDFNLDKRSASDPSIRSRKTYQHAWGLLSSSIFDRKNMLGNVKSIKAPRQYYLSITPSFVIVAGVSQALLVSVTASLAVVVQVHIDTGEHPAGYIIWLSLSTLFLVGSLSVAYVTKYRLHKHVEKFPEPPTIERRRPDIEDGEPYDVHRYYNDVLYDRRPLRMNDKIGPIRSRHDEAYGNRIFQNGTQSESINNTINANQSANSVQLATLRPSTSPSPGMNGRSSVQNQTPKRSFRRVSRHWLDVSPAHSISGDLEPLAATKNSYEYWSLRDREIDIPHHSGSRKEPASVGRHPGRLSQESVYSQSGPDLTNTNIFHTTLSNDVVCTKSGANSFEDDVLKTPISTESATSSFGARLTYNHVFNTPASSVADVPVRNSLASSSAGPGALSTTTKEEDTSPNRQKCRESHTYKPTLATTVSGTESSVPPKLNPLEAYLVKHRRTADENAKEGLGMEEVDEEAFRERVSEAVVANSLERRLNGSWQSTNFNDVSGRMASVRGMKDLRPLSLLKPVAYSPSTKVVAAVPETPITDDDTAEIADEVVASVAVDQAEANGVDTNHLGPPYIIRHPNLYNPNPPPTPTHVRILVEHNRKNAERQLCGLPPFPLHVPYQLFSLHPNSLLRSPSGREPSFQIAEDAVMEGAELEEMTEEAAMRYFLDKRKVNNLPQFNRPLGQEGQAEEQFGEPVLSRDENDQETILPHMIRPIQKMPSVYKLEG